MRIATLVVRVLLGLLFLFASIAFFLNPNAEPAMSGDIALFMTGLKASGYMMPVVKLTELVCGLAFVSGFFVPLATVVIFPITLNIFLVHACLMPEGLVVASAVLVANLFLAYVHRSHYAGLLKRK